MTILQLSEFDDFVPVSALNAFLYCERRAALRHIENLYVHNEHTRQGDRLHQRADKSGYESRPGVRIERGLWIFSRKLKLYGRADLVEFRPDPSDSTKWRPFPVEYKNGRAKKYQNDDVQLCAQSLCLEEMLGVEIPEAAVFHAKSKKRRVVPLTDDLRCATKRTIESMHELLKTTLIPAPILKPQCKGCSLKEHCLPESTSDPNRTQFLAQSLFNPSFSNL